MKLKNYFLNSNENIYVYQSLSQISYCKLNETDIYVLLSIEED